MELSCAKTNAQCLVLLLLILILSHLVIDDNGTLCHALILQGVRSLRLFSSSCFMVGIKAYYKAILDSY